MALHEKPASTALLVMDMQRGIVARYGESLDLLDWLAGAIDAARDVGVPVIYVTVKFREGHPEVSPRNRGFSTLAGSGTFVETNSATEIHPAVAPRPGEVVVTKRRISAFAGSDLEIVLRAMGIDSLVLTGLATSGVVLSTLRAAADMDYRLTVLSDCCRDQDEEVHRVLLTKIFPRQADVLTSRDWIHGLREGKAAP